MREPDIDPLGEPPGELLEGGPGNEEEEAGIWAKLFLTLFPFLLVLLFLLLEWWLRGRS
jgi:hypothetical protein